MKTATVPSRGPLSLGLSLLMTPCCVLSLLAPGSATAESVDSELLLLVDVANGGLKKGEFDILMQGYASALTSTQVIDSIASGKIGRIAVSLSYYGTSPDQSAGIPWMAIGSAAEAQVFANRLISQVQPDGGKFTYEEALAQGVLSFGTETGGPADNGFQSAVQIVEVVSASRPKGDVAGATAFALSQGVDMIGATLAGENPANLESFYTANVIGGAVGGTVASVSISPSIDGLAGTLQGQLSNSVGAVSTIPEPSSAVFFLSSMGALLLFSRKRGS